MGIHCQGHGLPPVGTQIHHLVDNGKSFFAGAHEESVFGERDRNCQNTMSFFNRHIKIMDYQFFSDEYNEEEKNWDDE